VKEEKKPFNIPESRFKNAQQSVGTNLNWLFICDFSRKVKLIWFYNTTDIERPNQTTLVL
jgi:hypothetical protein